MAERVILHIGVMKSGTSYVQRLLAENRPALSEQGFLFPGRSWADQVRAVSEVVERKRVVTPPPQGAWQQLVDEVDAWPGTGIVSMEFLAQAGQQKIAAICSSFPAGSVEVVVTARDLGRAVPAMWQETLKNGRFLPFDPYVAAIAADEGLGRRFWREQGLNAICDRWAAAVGPDRLAVVTVPPRGAETSVLWHRFAGAVRLEPAGFAEPGPANESLGAASAEVLRQLNGRLADIEFGEYSRRVKQKLSKRVLAARRVEEPAVGFEPPPWLKERSAAMVERLRESGVRVVGDLADLEPAPVEGVPPGTVGASEQLDAAVAALEGLVRADKGRHRDG